MKIRLMVRFLEYRLNSVSELLLILVPCLESALRLEGDGETIEFQITLSDSVN